MLGLITLPGASPARLLLLLCCCAAGRRDKLDEQLSLEFEREGDTWQLRLVPANADGSVSLFLRLTSEDKTADYSVIRNWRLRALHPADAAQSVWKPNLDYTGPMPFVAQQDWGIPRLLAAADVAGFLHNGHVTLQAVIWKPSADELAAAANDPLHLQLLHKTFGKTDEAVIQRVIAQQGGDIRRAFAELLRWSPTELKQPLKDEDGHEMFTWRVPLQQCQ